MLQNVRAEILQQLSARGDKLSQEAEFSPWLSHLEPINTFLKWFVNLKQSSGITQFFSYSSFAKATLEM